jgi:predicted outer membrane repeat protein
MYGGGGGICCLDANITIDNCLISNNTATEYGGGIYGYGDSNVDIHNTVILDNFVFFYGGGIAVEDNSDFYVTNTVISGNCCGDYGYGGGILHNVADGSLNLEYCVVSGNRSDLDGGGIEIWGAAMTMENCTIYGNEAPGYGSQIDCWNNELQINAYNLIIGGNTANASVYFNTGAIAFFDYCDFNNSGGPDFAGSIPTGLGVITGVNVNGDSCDVFMNIFEDPEFVYPIQNDYRLSWGSACIDAGDPLYTDPDATV